MWRRRQRPLGRYPTVAFAPSLAMEDLSDRNVRSILGHIRDTIPAAPSYQMELRPALVPAHVGKIRTLLVTVRYAPGSLVACSSFPQLFRHGITFGRITLPNDAFFRDASPIITKVISQVSKSCLLALRSVLNLIPKSFHTITQAHHDELKGSAVCHA
jgi:hypothetical protein